MATVFDAALTEVISNGQIVGTAGGDAPVVNLITGDVSIIEIMTAGPQGPAGPANIVIQATDPSATWGIDQEGWIWVPTA